MYIQVAVENAPAPDASSARADEEFEEEATKHSKGSPEAEGFFAKVKEFFDGKS